MVLAISIYLNKSLNDWEVDLQTILKHNWDGEHFYYWEILHFIYHEDYYALYAQKTNSVLGTLA